MVEKKLLRSTKDRKLLGVCAGIANYFNLDPTIIRIAWVFLSLFAGSGILAYIIFAIIMPEDDGTISVKPDDVKDENK